MIIAIDGPSGAGKSTVAKAVAKRLGFSCLDTGRCIAPSPGALSRTASDSTTRTASGASRAPADRLRPRRGDPSPRRVFIDGVEVTDAIRTARIDKAVSPTSAAPSVRTALVDQQRRIGSGGDYVVEGRDIGTVVFPDAAVKVFLTASDEERALRRVRQNVDRGIGSTDYDEVLADLRRRDEADSSRATSPLVAAEDAVRIDSTSHGIEEVIDDLRSCGRRAP